MRLYVGRIGNVYEFGTKKNSWRNPGGFQISNDSFVYAICKEEFEKLFGLKLAPGEIRKVKSIKIEVE